MDSECSAKLFASLRRVSYLIDGLDYDRQLMTDHTLKMKIKRLLGAQLKTHDRPGSNPFAPDATVRHHPKPKTTETPIEKIRERNRYIK